jgi:RHS repeat-associated protein
MEKGGRRYRLLTDQLGSVRLVVDAESGAIAQAMTYDPFGRVLSDSNSGFQPFGFAGGLYDPATGLTHFGAREYDGETGRWTSADPISFAGGDANLYGYVLGDPANLVDPSGLYGLGDLWGDTKGTLSEVPNTLEWWGKQIWENPVTSAAIVAGAVCVAVSGGLCTAAIAASGAVGVISAGIDTYNNPECWRSNLLSAGLSVFPVGFAKAFAKMSSQMITPAMLPNEFGRAGVRAYGTTPWVGTSWAAEQIQACVC